MRSSECRLVFGPLRTPILTHLSHRALVNIGKDHDLTLERGSIAEEVCAVRKASRSSLVRSLCSALYAELEKFAVKKLPLSKKLL